jgi:hypothetical protein
MPAPHRDNRSCAGRTPAPARARAAAIRAGCRFRLHRLKAWITLE